MIQSVESSCLLKPSVTKFFFYERLHNKHVGQVGLTENIHNMVVGKPP